MEEKSHEGVCQTFSNCKILHRNQCENVRKVKVKDYYRRWERMKELLFIALFRKAQISIFQVSPDLINELRLQEE